MAMIEPFQNNTLTTPRNHVSSQIDKLGLTPTQRDIAAFLIAQGGEWVTGPQVLEHALPPRRDLKNVHVQIHRMVRKGAPVLSKRGTGGNGYAWGAAA